MPRLDDEQEEAYCRVFVSCWNVAKTAKTINMGIDNAYHVSVRPRIRKRIKELNEMNLREADITAKRVLLELARVGFSDIRKIVDADGRLKALVDLDDDVAASISGIEVEQRMESEMIEDLASGEKTQRFTPVVTTKIKRSDKVAALNILAKHFKLVGDEGDGVNALASALADRLDAADRRLAQRQPLQEIEDARIIDNDPARGERRAGEEIPQPRNGHRPDAEGLRNDGSAALAVRE